MKGDEEERQGVVRAKRRVGGRLIPPHRPMEPDPLKCSKIYFGITPADFTIIRDPE